MNAFTCSALLLSAVFFTVQGSWTVETAYDGLGMMPAIVLDSNDDPHIAHCGPFYLRYSQKSETTWNNTVIHPSTYSGPSWVDIAVNDEDLCRVSFLRSGILYYSAYISPIGWQTEIVNPLVNSDFTSIALDPTGYARITSYDNIAGSLVFVAWNGIGWEIQPVTTVGDQGEYNSLVVDPDGTPHVAFTADDPSNSVKYACRDQYGDWQVSLVDTPPGNPAGISLAIDDGGFPHISYSTPSEIRYAHLEGSSWTVEIVDAIDTGLNELDTSLALDQFGYPHIAHCMCSGDSLMYSVNQGGGWETEAVCAISPDMSGDPDLALDSMGRPHIAFSSEDDLKYAFNDEPSGTWYQNEALQPTSICIGPNPFSGVMGVSINRSPKELSRVRILDVSGRLVDELGAGNPGTGCTSFLWQPGPEVPDGTYFLVVESGENVSAERCVFLR